MAGKKNNSDSAPNSSEFLTRRNLLKSAVTLGAAAAAHSLMPFNVRRVLAQGISARGSLTDIKHVVILMQENRSFDHYFGTFAGVQRIQRSESR